MGSGRQCSHCVQGVGVQGWGFRDGTHRTSFVLSRLFVGRLVFGVTV